jgi:hypothetical protein
MMMSLMASTLRGAPQQQVTAARLDRTGDRNRVTAPNPNRHGDAITVRHRAEPESAR